MVAIQRPKLAFDNWVTLVLDRAISDCGRYLLRSAPDVTSGFLNAAHVYQFASLSRPLSVTGLSQHSVGHNAFISGRGHASRQSIQRDLGDVARIHERLV